MSGSHDYLTDEIVDAYARSGIPWQMITPRLAALKQRELDLHKQAVAAWNAAVLPFLPPTISYFKIPARNP